MRQSHASERKDCIHSVLALALSAFNYIMPLPLCRTLPLFTMLIAVLGGCSSLDQRQGEVMSATTVTVPSTWSTSAPELRENQLTPDQLASWWRGLGDEQLTQLIDTALTAAPDVRSAQARLRQARAAGLKTQFMGPEGVANVSLSNIAGESAEGLLVTKPKNYDQVPANKPIVDAIKAKKQDPSGAFVWTTYAALQSLQAGLNQSDDPAEIAKYLKANSVETVMGPLSWDAKGDLKGFEFGVFDWHANGTATDAK